jgi:hypothetical protein
LGAPQPLPPSALREQRLRLCSQGLGSCAALTPFPFGPPLRGPPFAPTGGGGWAEPLPKAEAKLLVDKKELFIKRSLMKRGLGGRGPHVTALLSGFMGAKLPEGEARVFRGSFAPPPSRVVRVYGSEAPLSPFGAGCLGGISREAKLPHPHQALLSGFLGAKLPKGQSPGGLGGREAKLPHLP